MSTNTDTRSGQDIDTRLALGKRNLNFDKAALRREYEEEEKSTRMKRQIKLGRKGREDKNTKNNGI